jgi:hypothetical protein
MSLLAPEIHSALAQLLQALSTPDNAIRSQAEEQLNSDWVQNRPDVLLMGLAEQLQGAENTVVIAESPVLNPDPRANILFSLRSDEIFFRRTFSPDSHQDHQRPP